MPAGPPCETGIRGDDFHCRPVVTDGSTIERLHLEHGVVCFSPVIADRNRRPRQPSPLDSLRYLLE